MEFDEGAVHRRIERAFAAEWDLEQPAVYDIAFHMTDWLRDLRAYADGVNAGIELTRAQPWKLSPEFVVLGVRPEPWTIEDSLCLGLLYHVAMSPAMGEELARAVELARLGRERAVDLWGWSPREADRWIPPARVPSGGSLAQSPSVSRSPMSGRGRTSASSQEAKRQPGCLSTAPQGRARAPANSCIASVCSSPPSPSPRTSRPSITTARRSRNWARRASPASTARRHPRPRPSF